MTKNANDECVNIKSEELDKLEASVALMVQLEEGEKSARENGWISADYVEAELFVFEGY